MTFKALTGLGPDYLEQLFIECNNDIYSLRSTNTKLALPKPRTNFLKRSFSYRAAKSWNELSNEITGDFLELSVSAFKRRQLLKRRQLVYASCSKKILISSYKKN